VAPEGVLERVECPGLVAGREALDRRDVGAVGLAGQQQAGADGGPVEPDRAGAAHAVLATDVRAAQPEIVAEEVRQ
jgi:hypothetical protein